MGSEGEAVEAKCKGCELTLGSPVELAGRWGRATQREFAGWRFIETTADISERSVQRDRLALYRHHCGHKKAIPLDKRAKMA